MKKLIILILTVFLSAVLSAGCEISVAPEDAEMPEQDDESELAGTLKIWLLRESNPVFSDLSYCVRYYNESRPSITLEITEFDNP